jgi:hypothetical protein
MYFRTKSRASAGQHDRWNRERELDTPPTLLKRVFHFLIAEVETERRAEGSARETPWML